MTKILIPVPQIPPIDPRTGRFAREWYRYFELLQQAVGGDTNIIIDTDLLAPPNGNSGDPVAQTEAMEAWGQASANAGEIAQLRKGFDGLLWQVPGAREPGQIEADLDALTPFGMPPTELGHLEAAKNLSHRIVAAGNAALVAGTVTVNTVYADSANEFLLTAKVVAGTQGILSVGTVTANTSFVINSSDAADTSTVSWAILAALKG